MPKTSIELADTVATDKSFALDEESAHFIKADVREASAWKQVKTRYFVSWPRSCRSSCSD